MLYTYQREASLDKNGVRFYTVTSPFQSTPNLLRILEPRQSAPGQIRHFLYVLPVNPGLETHWGDGLEVVRRLNFHEEYGCIVIAPAFSDYPWYTDHPTNPLLRQESYLMQGILPLIDEIYPGSKGQKLLLGFSKSGVGAFSLLLRHPAVFDAAAAWDAPLMKTNPDEFEMPATYGTPANFKQYEIPRLLQHRAPELLTHPHLVLAGYDAFRSHMQKAHLLLENLSIPHFYLDGPHRPHRWDSGWIEEVLPLLFFCIIKT